MTAVLLIAAANCRAVCGFSFVHAIRLAERMGVPVLRIGSRKRAIDAQAFLTALKVQNEREQAAAEPVTKADERAAMLRKLRLVEAR